MDTYLDRDISEFGIVRPADARRGEDFLANELRYTVWKNRGVALPLRDVSAGPEAYEFIIGGEAPEGYFTLESEGHKILAHANNMFGYMDLSSFLCNHYFHERFHASIPAEWYKKQILYQDVFEKKTAAHRVIFHNVWGMDAPHEGGRSRYAAAYHLAYAPDIIALNEFYGPFSENGVYERLITEGGYRPVPVKKEDLYRERSANPMWYRPDCLTLLYSRHVDYGMRDSSKGATVAVFEEAGGGKRRFIVIGTHPAAAWDTTQAEKYYRQLKNQQILLEAMKPIYAAWGDLPTLIGGDMNTRPDGECYMEYARRGYFPAFEIAERKNDRCSCHAYPAYCEELGVYHTGNPANDGTRQGGIDHAFVSRPEKIRVALYRVNQETAVPVIADHCPQMMDFDLL